MDFVPWRPLDRVIPTQRFHLAVPPGKGDQLI